MLCTMSSPIIPHTGVALLRYKSSTFSLVCTLVFIAHTTKVRRMNGKDSTTLRTSEYLDAEKRSFRDSRRISLSLK